MTQVVPVRVRPSAPYTKLHENDMQNIRGYAVLTAYAPILVFIALGIAFGLVPILLGWLIAPRRPNKEKLSPYECGFAAFEDARLPFDVRYYLVAILFIIFDLETAFLFPWGVALRDIGWFGLLAMMLFLGLLVIGFIFEWKKGALEWE